MSLGSASKSAFRHKISTFIFVPVSIWFIFFIACCAKHGFNESFAQAIGMVHNAILLILFIILIAYNLMYEMRVILEDYVKCKKIRWISIMSLVLFIGITTIGLLISVMYLHFMMRMFAFCG